MVLLLVGLAAAALAGRVLLDSSDELLAAADTVTSVRLGWVVIAVMVELLSYLARGGASAVVLRQGGGEAGTVTLAAAVLAGDAAAYCLPFGFAASGVVVVGVLRRRRIGAAVASWMFAVTSVCYVAAITVLTLVAVQIAGDQDPVPGLQAISGALLGALVAIAAGYALLRRRGMRGVLVRLLRWLRARLPQRLGSLLPGVRPALASGGRLRGSSGAVRSRIRMVWREWERQLRTVRLTPGAGVTAFVLMLVSWMADVAVLALAFVALGSPPPWTGLLLAYCAGQIAASLPVTPGGIGMVEGSITLALVAFGGAEIITLAAVLLYRLIAYWGCIPAGGLAWLGLRATSRAQARARHPATQAAAPTSTAQAESS